MDITPVDIAIGVGFLLVLALAIIAGTLWQRHVSRQKAAQATQLGFQPARLDKTRVKQITDSLRRFPRDYYFLRNAFYRRSSQGDMYITDVWEPGNESSNQVYHDAIALVTSGASLPFFFITPMPADTNPFSSLGNTLQKSLINSKCKLHFEGVPGFDGQFFVATLDPKDNPVVEAILNQDLRRPLSSLTSASIHVGGDVIAIAHLKGKKPPKEQRETWISWEITTVEWLSQELVQAHAQALVGVR